MTTWKIFEVRDVCRVLFKQRWHIRRADDGAGMHGHQRDSAKGGNCLEMFGNASFSLLEISIVWDPHLFASNFGGQFCVRQHNQKMNLFLIHVLKLALASKRGAVEELYMSAWSQLQLLIFGHWFDFLCQQARRKPENARHQPWWHRRKSMCNEITRLCDQSQMCTYWETSRFVHLSGLWSACQLSWIFLTLIETKR